MGAETDLHRLVDLALRSPDAGVVNFNHLHSLLHAILNHIGLSYDPQNGVLNTQSAAAPDEGNDKGTSFEQLNGSGKEISDADNSNRDENRLVQTTIQLDQRGHFDRFDKLLVFHTFITTIVVRICICSLSCSNGVSVALYCSISSQTPFCRAVYNSEIFKP